MPLSILDLLSNGLLMSWCKIYSIHKASVMLLHLEGCASQDTQQLFQAGHIVWNQIRHKSATKNPCTFLKVIL